MPNGSITVAAADAAPSATRINVIGLVAVHGTECCNVDTNGFITLTATDAASIARRVVVAQAFSPIDPDFVTTSDVTVPFGPNADLRLGLVRSTDDDATPTLARLDRVRSGRHRAPAGHRRRGRRRRRCRHPDDGGHGGWGTIGTDTNFVGSIHSSYARYGVLNADAAGVIRITETPSAPGSGDAAANPTICLVTSTSTPSRPACAGRSRRAPTSRSTTTAGSILDGHAERRRRHRRSTSPATRSTCSRSAAASAASRAQRPGSSPATSRSTRHAAAAARRPTACGGSGPSPPTGPSRRRDIAAEADADIDLTELDGPAAVLLARTQADIRLTTTETTVEGNDILVLHSGATLVREPVSPSLVPNVQAVPRGLIQAQSEDVLRFGR